MALIISDFTKHWPGGCLIWRFDPGLSNDEKALFRRAMEHWAGRANVRFLERTVQASYVTYKTDPTIDNVNHSSSIGMAGGEQFIYLDPITIEDNRTKSSRHEIGHTLGFYHEHMRCDRDSFVSVSDKIKLDRLHDFFPKLCGNDVIQVGDYDFSSVMHYNPTPGATTDGTDGLRGSNNDNQELLDDRASRRAVSPGDTAGIAKLHGGNAHVYQLSGRGQIEKTVGQYSWPNGWTTSTPFGMDVRNFLFLIKESNGINQTFQVNADGSIPDTPIDSRNWSSGWTSAMEYAIGPFNYFFLYKRGDGSHHLHDMNIDGKIGRRIENVKIEEGWTSIRRYTIGLDNFLLFVNANTGDWRIRRIQWNGRVGESINADTWSPGWTSVEPFSSGGNNFVLRLKARTGALSIKSIRPNGELSRNDSDTRRLNPGFNIVIPYEVSGNTYVVMMNTTTGSLFIHHLLPTGKIGALTDRREFGPGWTVGSIYHVGAGTFLNLIKA
jgi:astacin